MDVNILVSDVNILVSGAGIVTAYITDPSKQIPVKQGDHLGW